MTGYEEDAEQRIDRDDSEQLRLEFGLNLPRRSRYLRAGVGAWQIFNEVRMQLAPALSFPPSGILKDSLLET